MITLENSRANALGSATWIWYIQCTRFDGGPPYLDIGNEVEIRHDDNDDNQEGKVDRLRTCQFGLCNDHQPTGYCGQLDSGHPVMLSATQDNTDRGNCQFGITCSLCFKDNSTIRRYGTLQSNLEQERWIWSTFRHQVALKDMAGDSHCLQHTLENIRGQGRWFCHSLSADCMTLSWFYRSH